THTTRTAAGAGGGYGAAVKATPASDHRTLQLTLASGGPGEHLTGAGGRALYLWEGDRHNRSNCTGGCVQIWPPLLSRSKPAAGRGVRAAEIGLITRRGGQRQVTFNGHPLYYYLGDSGRGSAAGEGSAQFGAKWWVVGPSGTAVTGARTSGSSGNASGSGGSGSSSGSGW
ncbi:MAG TPA: hypothetical protein VFN65_14895, partial [Solirubrobacteraceae bacterium]|nr:hypothetical protein [Solirubrobacteraceae bacterium]